MNTTTQYIRELLDTRFHGLVNMDTIQEQKEQNGILMTVRMNRQMHIETLTDTIVNRLKDVKILYACCNEQRSAFHVVGFSVPYTNEQYIFQIVSKQYGMADTISFLVYDSLEKEMKRVLELYQQAQLIKGSERQTLLELLKYDDIISAFF